MSEDVHTPGPRHLVAAAVTRLRGDVAELAGAGLWSMSTQDAASTLGELTSLNAQVADLTMRVLRQAATVEVGTAQGVTSTAD